MSEDKTKEDNKKQADKDKPKINLNDSQMYDFICNLLKEVEGSDGDLFEYTPKSVKKLLAIHTGGLDPRKSHRWIFYNSTVFASVGLVSLFIPTKGTPFTPIGTLSIIVILGLAIDGVLGACSAFPNIRYFNKLKKYQKELEKLAGFEFEITDNDTYFAQIALMAYLLDHGQDALDVLRADNDLKEVNKMFATYDHIPSDVYEKLDQKQTECLNRDSHAIYKKIKPDLTDLVQKIVTSPNKEIFGLLPYELRNSIIRKDAEKIFGKDEKKVGESNA